MTIKDGHACSRSNMMAIEMVTEHLKVKLQQHPLERQYPNLECMKSSPIVKELHTLIRDRRTGRADFVFYADRLIRLVVETGLGYLPFKEKCVTTPDGHHYVGVDFARSLCGVSIIRSGEAMESALRDCCQGIKIGKVLFLFLSSSIWRMATCCSLRQLD
jgi:uridine kinase